MKRYFILSLLLFFSLATYAETTFTIDGIEYTSSTAGVASVKSGSGCSGDVVIPDSVSFDNAVYEIRTISASAFKNNTLITSITIPKTITSMGSSAFSGCTGLLSVKWNAANCGNFTSTASSRPFNGLTNITSIEFGDEVTSIPAYLCYGLTGLNGSLDIPDAVTSIGTYAFYNCTGLTSVTIGKAVTSVGQNAFTGCTGMSSVKWNAVNCGNFSSTASSRPFNGLTNITTIEFGDEVTKIPAYMCHGLSSLNCALVIPESVTSIGTHAFYGCSGLNGSLVIPNAVASIGTYAFYGCSGLNGSLVIPDAVTSVGTYTFYNCTGLTSVTIGKSVTSVGQYAFTGCTDLSNVKWNAVKCDNFTSTASSRPFNGLTNITTIEFGEGVTKIPAYLCYGLSSLNCTLIFPESVTSIGTRAFYGCSGLNGSLVIPDAVTSIGTYAFYGCSGLNGSLVIPDAVTSVGTYTFYNCSGLTSVSIGKAVASVGQYAFAGCTGLLSVRWNAVNCADFTSTATSRPFNGLTNITSIEFGEDVTKIPAYLCHGLTGLNCALVIPDAVTSIGTNAFYNCTGLTSVSIGKAVASVGQYAFAGCTGLLSVRWNAVNCADFTSTATSRPFNGLTNITSIEFGEEVTKIPAYLCYGLTGLNCTLILPGSLTSIGTYAFYGCSGLNGSLSIPDAVTSISSYTFYGCNGLDSALVISDSVTSIGTYAFYDCSGFTSATIGKAVTSIGKNAFAGCTGLLSMRWNAANCADFTSTATSQPFNGLTNMTSIEFGDDVTTIPAYLCYGLTGLNCALVIPDSVTAIGSYAFNGCSGLATTLVIPPSVLTIGRGAFNGCTGITKVILEDGSDELDNDYASYSYSGGDPYAGYGYEGSSSCAYTFNTCNVDSIYIGRKVKNYLFGTNSSSWGNGSSSDYYGKNTKVKTIIYGCNQKYLEKLCTGIETLTFLENVTSLSSSSIASTVLKDVYVYWLDPPTIAESFFTTAAYNNAILHVPEGTTNTYNIRTGWKNFTIVENVLPIVVGDVNGDGVFTIGDISEIIDLLLFGNASSVAPRIYDLNSNGKLDIGDITSLIDLLLYQ